MPIIIIVLLAMLIGTVGFWDTIGALLGAVAVIALFWLLLIATGAFLAFWAFRRMTRR